MDVTSLLKPAFTFAERALNLRCWLQVSVVAVFKVTPDMFKLGNNMN